MVELPLLFFTICEDLAIGAIFFLAILDLAGKFKLAEGEEKDAKDVRVTIALVAVIVAVVGLIISMFHMGRPFRALNVFAGLGTSWLSREILAYGIFLVLAIIYLLLLWKKKGAARAIGILAALAGLAALMCTSMCYLLPGIPAWNSALTPLMFFVAAACMGLSFVMWMNKKAQGADNANKWLVAFCIITAVFFVWRFLFYSNIVLLVYAL